MRRIQTKLLLTIFTSTLCFYIVYSQDTKPIVNNLHTASPVFYAPSESDNLLVRAYQLGFTSDSILNSLFVEHYDINDGKTKPIVQINFDSVVIVRDFVFNYNSNILAIVYNEEIYSSYNGERIAKGWSNETILEVFNIANSELFRTRFDSNFVFYDLTFNSYKQVNVFGVQKNKANKNKIVSASGQDEIKVYSITDKIMECKANITTNGHVERITFYHLDSVSYVSIYNDEILIYKITNQGAALNFTIPETEENAVDFIVDTVGNITIVSRITNRILNNKILIKKLSPEGKIVWENTINAYNFFDIDSNLKSNTYILGTRRYIIWYKFKRESNNVLISLDGEGRKVNVDRVKHDNEFRKILLNENDILLLK